jgi:tripeptidyl-peptidase-1
MMFLAPQADGNTDPNLLWQYYKIPNTPITQSGATQAVFEALGQSYDPTDLSSFEQQYNIPSQTATLVGPNDGSQCAFNPNNCAEASLDIQYIIAVASGAPTTFWSIDASENDPFTEWMKEQLAKGDAAPKVTSISYGGIENEQDPTSMNAFNNDLQKLAASGITVAVSSGDDGVAGYIARTDPTQCGYNPEYPASCPYVLAVGATQGPETGSTEIVCSSSTGGLITSGGGFSTVFNQPSYQSSAVSAFLAQTQAPSGYNAQGRGFPDVAMLGHNYIVLIGGTSYILSGTSCSAPVTGGIISRANAKRLASGKSTLGFINPAIYQNANTFFNRVTSGTNNCCAGQGSPVCCTQGFSAWSGWSPTTGCGSIQVDMFIQTLV